MNKLIEVELFTGEFGVLVVSHIVSFFEYKKDTTMVYMEGNLQHIIKLEYSQFKKLVEEAVL